LYSTVAFPFIPQSAFDNPQLNKATMIIPFFIPHAGCPHQCVFCNQKNITGQVDPIDPSMVPLKIGQYLATGASNEAAHVAFYGGSFTALPFETQKAYLTVVQPFIHAGQIAGIRLSTRPDCITNEILSLLNEYHVTTIELGVQSMDDVVLTRSGRGHTTTDTVNAVSLIKSSDFLIGLQLMPGLPGDSADSFMKTIGMVIELKPDFVRIYPSLVIKDTPLEDLYTSGRYMPLSFDNAVTLCREALERFELAGIDVIRIGLQPTEELEKPGTIIAGPYHPAFRQLVESSILLDAMRSLLMNRKERTDTAVFQVNPKNLSAAIGRRRSNIDILKKEFRLQEIRIVEGTNVSGRRELTLISSGQGCS
jgi:histone acetyltransferase (RNA polymerase elongator complex component)